MAMILKSYNCLILMSSIRHLTIQFLCIGFLHSNISYLLQFVLTWSIALNIQVLLLLNSCSSPILQRRLVTFMYVLVWVFLLLHIIQVPYLAFVSCVFLCTHSTTWRTTCIRMILLYFVPLQYSLRLKQNFKGQSSPRQQRYITKKFFVLIRGGKYFTSTLCLA